MKLGTACLICFGFIVCLVFQENEKKKLQNKVLFFCSLNFDKLIFLFGFLIIYYI